MAILKLGLGRERRGNFKARFGEDEGRRGRGGEEEGEREGR
jgi:hypothetical protein